MHPVLSDQLARLHPAELHRAADHRGVAAVATRRTRRVRSAAATRPRARTAGEAEACPP